MILAKLYKINGQCEFTNIMVVGLWTIEIILRYFKVFEFLFNDIVHIDFRTREYIAKSLNFMANLPTDPSPLSPSTIFITVRRGPAKVDRPRWHILGDF